LMGIIDQPPLATVIAVQAAGWQVVGQH